MEKSLVEQRFDRSLIQMATGAGKTCTAVTLAYRLLRYGGSRHILFLVDRNDLGDQTIGEFQNYRTPDDGRRFTEHYNVDTLTSAGMPGSSSVVVPTTQRVFTALRGEEVADRDDPQLDGFVPDAPITVAYSRDLPPESFDLYRIRTEISEQGARIDAGVVVPTADRRTRAQKPVALDVDLECTHQQLDRAVTHRSRIRTVLETFRDRLFTEIFPRRTTVPGTLIFAEDDACAEEIATTAREVFGGNDFAARSTYQAQNPRGHLKDLRTSPSLQKLLERASALTLTGDETAALASRLAAPELQLSPEEREELDDVACRPLQDIARGLVEAVDPDRQALVRESSPDPDGAVQVLLDAHGVVDPGRARPVVDSCG